MPQIYRVRKNIFGKCILQEYVVFPDCLPNAPAPAWQDVDYERAPLALIETSYKQPIEKPKE